MNTDIEALRRVIEEDLRAQMPGWSDSAVAELVEIAVELRMSDDSTT